MPHRSPIPPNSPALPLTRYSGLMRNALLLSLFSSSLACAAPLSQVKAQDVCVFPQPFVISAVELGKTVRDNYDKNPVLNATFLALGMKMLPAEGSAGCIYKLMLSTLVEETGLEAKIEVSIELYTLTKDAAGTGSDASLGRDWRYLKYVNPATSAAVDAIVSRAHQATLTAFLEDWRDSHRP